MQENNENPSMEEILLSIKSILSGEVEKADDVVADSSKALPSSKIFDLTKDMLVEAPQAFIASEK